MKSYELIHEGHMTDRQKKLMKIGRFEEKNRLGKIFREERVRKARKRKLQKESRRRNRKR